MRLRVGIIGAGMIGREHGRRIAQALTGADVVAVADANPDAAQQLAAELSNAGVRATGHELIADETVDAVVVTSPAPAHEEYAIAAIESGKPVFCEKPLASSERACRTIMAAEAVAGRRLIQVGFMRRYDLAYRALKQTLDEGAIGTALIYYSAHRTAAAPQGWTGDMAIVDAAVHDFDISRWLLGEELTSIQVVAGKQNSHDLRDPLVMILETTSGVLVHVETSLNLGYGYDIRGEVVGQFGTAALSEPRRDLVRSAGSSRIGVPRDWRERFADAYDVELQEWIDAARAGAGATGPSAWDGYVAQVVSEAGIAALHSGERVAVELIEKPGIYE